MQSNLKQFNKLAERCGNRYLAIRYLATIARRHGIQSHGTILESKLLTWALTGEQPYSDDMIETRRHIKLDSDLADLEDYLCYIDDAEVADRVRICYRESVHNRHLTLDSSNALDYYRQMRVNVILRMMWYGFEF